MWTAAADVDMAVDIIENAKGQPPLGVQRRGGLPGPPLHRPGLSAQASGPADGGAGVPGARPRWSCGWTRSGAAHPRHSGGEQDFDTEFLDYVLAIKLVDSVEQAMEHIAPPTPPATARPSSQTTRRRQSSSSPGWTRQRFTTMPPPGSPTGGEFGLGCEMGISTQKLHARGPMGLEELCSSRYVIRGTGQIR